MESSDFLSLGTAVRPAVEGGVMRGKGRVLGHTRPSATSALLGDKDTFIFVSYLSRHVSHEVSCLHQDLYVRASLPKPQSYDLGTLGPGWGGVAGGSHGTCVALPTLCVTGLPSQHSKPQVSSC